MPRLEARYIDNGGNKLGELAVTNHGPGDVYGLDVTDTEGLLRDNEDLPIKKLPHGKSIRLLVMMSSSLGDRRRTHFYVTIIGKTADGTPIELEEFVSTGA